MNTKYMPDYGLQTWAYHLSMSYPFDLDYLSPDDRRYNIYVATLIPKLNIDEDSVQFFENYIRFDVIVGTGEHTSRETLDISIFRMICQNLITENLNLSMRSHVKQWYSQVGKRPCRIKSPSCLPYGVKVLPRYRDCLYWASI